MTRKVGFTKSRSMSKRGIKLLIRQSRKTQFLILENSISYLGKLNFLSWKTQFLILENSISYLGKLNFLSWKTQFLILEFWNFKTFEFSEGLKSLDLKILKCINCCWSMIRWISIIVKKWTIIKNDWGKHSKPAI